MLSRRSILLLACATALGAGWIVSRSLPRSEPTPVPRGLSEGRSEPARAVKANLPPPVEARSIDEPTATAPGSTAPPSFEDALADLHRLGPDLDATRLQALFAQLEQPFGLRGFSDGQERDLRNGILNVLRSQRQPPRAFTEAVVGLWHSESTDPVLRDYALQHLSAWRDVVAETDPAASMLIETTLQAATSSREATYAGTALLALARFTVDGPSESIDSFDVVAAADRIATDDRMPLASRLSALSVLGQLSDQQALPQLEHAMSPRQAPLLQAAALGAVRQFRQRGLVVPANVAARVVQLCRARDIRVRTAALLAAEVSPASQP